MLRTLLSLLALTALGLTFAPAAAQQQKKTPVQQKPAPQKPATQPKTSVAGTWTGAVTQVGRSKGYTLAMTIHNKGGDTDYPDLACGGQLTRVGSAGGYTFFLETITRGRLDKGGSCIDGSITVAPAGKQLSWGWVGSHKNQTLVAYGTLKRR